MSDTDAFVSVAAPSSARRPRLRLVSECASKVFQMVLGARVLFSDADERVVSKTFNVEMEEVVAARRDLTTFLNTATAAAATAAELPPALHIDVMMESALRSGASPPAAAAATSATSRVLLERWSIGCESSAIRTTKSSVDDAAVYKKMMIMLRSVYSMLRTLPAHALFRQRCRAHQRSDPLPFTLFYTLSSSPSAVFSSPPANLVFTPIDTASGRLHLSVFYLKSCEFALATESTSSMRSLIIKDYVEAVPPASTTTTSTTATTTTEDDDDDDESSCEALRRRLPRGWAADAAFPPPPFASDDDYGTSSTTAAGAALVRTSGGALPSSTPPFLRNPSVLNATPPSSASIWAPPADPRSKPPIRLTVSPFKAPSLRSPPSVNAVDDADEAEAAAFGFARTEQRDEHAEVGELIEMVKCAPDVLDMFEGCVRASNVLLAAENIAGDNRSIAPLL